MTLDPRWRRLRCPSCRAGTIFRVDDITRCDACGAKRPAEGGIAALVATPETHEVALAEARKTNPLWYQHEQPPEAVSPWRHHLRKRRVYVERVLCREFARRSWVKAPSLLDLGCGDGNNLIWLAPHATEIFGCDYNPTRLGRAAARAPNTLIFLANLLDFPAPDGAFEVIFFNHVLEHIHDDDQALAEVRRILAPGGLLILGTPNEGSWWWQMAYDRAPEIKATTDHVQFYTASTLCQKVRRAGFDVSEVHHMGWGPPDFALDGKIRHHKWVDDSFEWIGRVILPTQASSLYVVAKPV